MLGEVISRRGGVSPPEMRGRGNPAPTVIASAAVINNTKIISPAYLTIEDGVFTRVASTPPQKKSTQEIKLPQTLLLPGFVNAHCHLELTALGSLARNRFVPWVQDLLSQKIKLSAETVQMGIRQGCESLLQSGVTTVFDHISSETPLRFFENLPISVIGFGEVLGVEKTRAEKNYITLKHTRKHAPIPLHITPHAFYSLHDDVMHTVLSDEPKPFSIHYLESAEEREFFEKQSGELWEFCRDALRAPTSPSPQPSPLLGEGAKKSLLIHANEVTDTELSLIKKNQNTIVHCPGSFAFFKHAKFPFEEIRTAGIPIALGTDSLASNFSLNFLDEIKRFVAMFPVKDFFEFLPQLTTNALTVLGMNDIGKISEGFQANMIGFNNPNERTPLETMLEKTQVDFVMIKGEQKI